MLRILFIDDDKKSIDTAKKTLRDNNNNTFSIYICNRFDRANEKIQDISPHIVILDWFEGSPDKNNTAGEASYEFMWKNMFCPVVIYSAQPPDDKDHPCVRKVTKGKGSDLLLLQAIKELEPHAQAVRTADMELRKQFAVAIRDISDYVFDGSDNKVNGELLMRCGRRRLAAYMDEQCKLGDVLKSWEQYLCPPISEQTRLGDVVQLKDGRSDTPESFRVVLTPTCDMVTTENRKAKVDKVLLGRCCSVRCGLAKINLTIGKKRDSTNIKDRLLSPGYCQGVVVLPKLASKIPSMMVNLRDLDLVSTDEFKEKYLTVASVDSPFRELFSWAYMQVACRPGLPDRDLNEWAEDITYALDEANR